MVSSKRELSFFVIPSNIANLSFQLSLESSVKLMCPLSIIVRLSSRRSLSPAGARGFGCYFHTSRCPLQGGMGDSHENKRHIEPVETWRVATHPSTGPPSETPESERSSDRVAATSGLFSSFSYRESPYPPGVIAQYIGQLRFFLLFIV